MTRPSIITSPMLFILNTYLGYKLLIPLFEAVFVSFFLFFPFFLHSLSLPPQPLSLSLSLSLSPPPPPPPLSLSDFQLWITHSTSTHSNYWTMKPTLSDSCWNSCCIILAGGKHSEAQFLFDGGVHSVGLLLLLIVLSLCCVRINSQHCKTIQAVREHKHSTKSKNTQMTWMTVKLTELHYSYRHTSAIVITFFLVILVSNLYSVYQMMLLHCKLRPILFYDAKLASWTGPVCVIRVYANTCCCRTTLLCWLFLTNWR